MITVFQRANEAHLTKDVGVVSDILSEKKNEKNILITTNHINDADNICKSNGLKNTQLKSVSAYGLFQISFGVLFFLLTNSGKHGAFVSFHVRYYTLIYALLYRVLNPQGNIYIKADMGDLDVVNHGPVGKGIICKFNILILHFLQGPNFFISYETSKGASSASDFFSKKGLDLSIRQVPNGIISTDLSPIDFSKKKNLAISVGRLSSPEKNNLMLVEAIKSYYKDNPLSTWEFVFIGPYTDSFKNIVEQANHSFKMNFTIKLLGPINDREKLFSYYKDAKLFLLPSIREGYPLVYPEAAYYGCAILSTPVSTAHDFVTTKRFGLVSSDFSAKSFSQLITTLTNSPDEISAISARQIYMRKSFLWHEILRGIEI